MLVTKFRHLLLATIVAAISLGSFSVVADTESIMFKIQHPQILSISIPTNNDVISSNEIIRTTSWVIKSNNAVEVRFSGTSPFDLDENTNQNVPRFYKQEVNARGELIADYDYLTTNFGVTIDHYDSTLAGGGSTWELVADPSSIENYIPYGTPVDLVLNDALIQQWGPIMPHDDGYFTLSLYSKGVVDSVGTQSGVYSMTVFLNISTNERLVQ